MVFEVMALQSVSPEFFCALKLTLHFMSSVGVEVKALCNVELGIITQCVRSTTVSAVTGGNAVDVGSARSARKVQQSIDSLFRQFAVKMGVIPWKVHFGESGHSDAQFNYLCDDALDLNVPTMIIGVDVNHNRRIQRSTIGFIATYDRDFCRVMGQVDVQDMGQEVVGIEKMELLTINALQHFNVRTGCWPQQILVYRDGVSLGELDAVTESELMAIRRAMTRLHFAAAIQFMVIQKRVNIRFFEGNQREHNEVGVRPRVIVDGDIVSANLWDFYLIACGAPRDKVANPVRVIVVNDGLNLAERNSKNDIELFTYSLCNLYFGWGGAVKVPNVIMYADKVAELYANTADLMHVLGHRVSDNKPKIAAATVRATHCL